MTSTAQRYDVYGVGNAITDIEVAVDDALLADRGIRKGMMALVSPEEQAALLSALSGRAQWPAAGGSVANTMVGVALFGGSALFTGKVGNDAVGETYRASMAEAGVELDVEAADGPTGTCLVLVTPDGERTMRTSLGSSSALGPADIRADRIARAHMVYVEGYLWGAESTASAGAHALEMARSAGVQTSLTLSDPSMVEHHGDELRRLVPELVEVVFCNEQEAKLYSRAGDRSEALHRLGQDCPLVFMTCGADGSMIYDRGEVTPVETYRVPVVDTTGAGDAYAAGALYGLAHGLAPERSGRLGSFAAARVVAQMGPRLSGSLAQHIPDILNGAHPLDPDFRPQEAHEGKR